MQSRKVPNWKAPGKDGVHEIWLERLTNLHERIAEKQNKMLDGEAEVPEWMTYG